MRIRNTAALADRVYAEFPATKPLIAAVYAGSRRRSRCSAPLQKATRFQAVIDGLQSDRVKGSTRSCLEPASRCSVDPGHTSLRLCLSESREPRTPESERRAACASVPCRRHRADSNPAPCHCGMRQPTRRALPPNASQRDSITPCARTHAISLRTINAHMT